MSATYIFRRVEKKYRMTLARRDAFLADIAEYLTPDAYGKSTVCSLYLDTPDFRIIRASVSAKGLEKPAYKEKLRIRSYGTPKAEDKVFFEIKKKYKGVVYKRRISATYEKVLRYLEAGEPPEQSQIMNEIDYAMRFYGEPAPAMMICCEREAYFVPDLPHLRITFDTNVRARDTRLSLSEGDDGELLLPSDIALMEVKTDGAMPLWLAHALDRHNLLPSSFSKYGTAYVMRLKQNKIAGFPLRELKENSL